VRRRQNNKNRESSSNKILRDHRGEAGNLEGEGLTSHGKQSKEC